MDNIEKKLAELWLIYTGEKADLASPSRFKDFGFDSLDLIDFAMDLEDSFGFDLPDGYEEKFAKMTFKNLVDFMEIQFVRKVLER